MEFDSTKLKEIIVFKKEADLISLLNSGFNPNFQEGWLIRLAARHGLYSIVKILMQFGANPHLLGESGASTLQLAVFSGQHWNSDKWAFLLSCSDSSQLADGAAVAIIFQNVAALKKIIETGRCNKNIPTTLTGKTVEALAKGYKQSFMLNNILETESGTNATALAATNSPRNRRQHRSETRASIHAHHSQRMLSPSVERFFNQVACQESLSPNRIHDFAPGTDNFNQ